MYGLAISLSAFGSLAGLRGRSTLFCICFACPWSARRVTGTVRRRVFCLRHALDASTGAVPCHAIEHAQGRRYNRGNWERMRRTREKDTRPVSLSFPKLVRSSPSSTIFLCNGDLALAHISTALKHRPATPLFHAFGWSVTSCQSRKSRDSRRLCPMGIDAIGQESRSGSHKFQLGTLFDAPSAPIGTPSQEGLKADFWLFHVNLPFHWRLPHHAWSSLHLIDGRVY